jgi:hypothetical protein
VLKLAKKGVLLLKQFTLHQSGHVAGQDRPPNTPLLRPMKLTLLALEHATATATATKICTTQTCHFFENAKKIFKHRYRFPRK